MHHGFARALAPGWPHDRRPAGPPGLRFSLAAEGTPECRHGPRLGNSRPSDVIVVQRTMRSLQGVYQALACRPAPAVRLRLGVTGAPLVPRNVPPPSPSILGRVPPTAAGLPDDVAALDMVVEPLQEAARADVQAAMVGAGVPLSPTTTALSARRPSPGCRRSGWPSRQ